MSETTRQGPDPRVIDRGDVLRKELDRERAAGRTVGLVPTMGALHPGHASLVRRSAAECDVTAVTIFVNPLQFGPGEDLSRYPRDLAADLVTASAAGATLAFAPPVEEMFPGGRSATTVRVAGLSDSLEGASRPGHFNGVATVVARLFNLAGPCRAYFGEKDLQQLAVVRRMVADLGVPVQVVGCKTVRDHDGVAWSSRNAYLSADERRAAPVLIRALEAGAEAIAGADHERNAGEVRRLMARLVAAEPLALLDYAEVVDPESLTPLDVVAPGAEVRLVAAAWIGGIRLIDNLGVTAP
ncbi:MAG TPA: pantoate--beta-alanine ligase [Acidimicrobiales bacterium]